jgi:hypothetical protein
VGAQGQTTIDFGAFPGASDASVVITGQTGILASSLVEAWLRPEATADHSADEHVVETLRVVAGNVVAGVGFTIYGVNTNTLNEPLTPAGVSRFRSTTTTTYGHTMPSIGGQGTRISGRFTVAWVWN